MLRQLPKFRRLSKPLAQLQTSQQEASQQDASQQDGATQRNRSSIPIAFASETLVRPIRTTARSDGKKNRLFMVRNSSKLSEKFTKSNTSLPKPHSIQSLCVTVRRVLGFRRVLTTSLVRIVLIISAATVAWGTQYKFDDSAGQLRKKNET